jgi:hypothetical protein
MGRKFFTAFLVASCVACTTGLANVAGAASGDAATQVSATARQLAVGNNWVAGPDGRGATLAATPSVNVNDGADDTSPVLDSRADIRQAQAGVDGSGSVFRMRIETPTNPNGWGTSHFGALWFIDNNFDGVIDWDAGVINTPEGVRAVLVNEAGTQGCFGSPAYDGTWVSATFGACGGVLHAFQWQAGMDFDGVVDLAPDNAGSAPTAAHRNGYFMLGADGKNYGFGGGPSFGGTAAHATAFATRHDGTGLWIVDASGHVFTRGRAPFKGGTPHLAAGEIVSAIANTTTDNGYILFTNRGRAFPFGDAHAHGDLTGHHLNGPIIAAVMTPTANGYFMVASDGGIFSFGDAHFRGSMGGHRLNAPIVGIAPTPDNRGYWLVGSDGGVFAFGSAGFRGSLGGHHLNAPVNGMIAYGNGYLMVASDGGVFVFSNRRFLGSLGGRHLSAPIIGIAAFAV